MLFHHKCVDVSRFQLYKNLYATDIADLASYYHNVCVFCSFQNLSVGLDIVLDHTRSLASILKSLLNVCTKSFQDSQ